MAVSWERDIFGLIPESDWLTIPFNPVRQNDPIDGLFGDQKTDNIFAEWQSIAYDLQIPKMAQFHAFDVESNTTTRNPVDNHQIEKGLIKVKINQSERMQALMRAGIRQDDMYRYIIEDGARLAEQVITRTKVAKNEVLATGKFTIKENHLDLTVDYGVDEDQTEFTVDLSPDSDIPSQIQAVIDAAKAKGVTITGILTSSAVVSKMRGNEAIQKLINGNIGAGALVRNSALNTYLGDEFGIQSIITNDLVYNASNKIGEDGRPEVVSKRYYPSDKITFFATNPNGKLGVGLWGNPPSVTNPLVNTTGSGVSPYVYIDQWTERDPDVIWTRASGLFVPVLYNPASIFIATVDDGA